MTSTDIEHSPDFATVRWKGHTYYFSGTRAAVVKYLLENRGLLVRQETILEAVNADSSRLRDLFKSKGKLHEAWGSLIVTPAQHMKGRGTYMIARAEPSTPQGSPLQPPLGPHEGCQPVSEDRPDLGADVDSRNDIEGHLEEIVALLAGRDFVRVVEAWAMLTASHGNEQIAMAAAALDAEPLFRGLGAALKASRGHPNHLTALERDLNGLANAWHPPQRMIEARGLAWVHEHMLAPSLGCLSVCAPEFLPFESKRGACPRCGNALERFPGDTGALSRLDNLTEVCGACQTDETLSAHGLSPGIPMLLSWADRFQISVPRLLRGAPQFRCWVDP